MPSRNISAQEERPSLTHWVEHALVTMPSSGRLTLKTPHDLAFGFTDDRKTEKGNQDRVAIAYCLDPAHSGDPWLFAGVCDGVGGEARGDIAASIAMAEILSELCTSERDGPGGRMSDAILRAHAAVKERLRGSATTFAGIFVTAGGTFTLGSVGDSRIYSVARDEIQQLSQDDTLEDMLRRHSSNVNDDNVRETLEGLKQQWRESLGQAIGSNLPIEPQIKSWPAAARNAGCLVCTDGVWKTVELVLAQTVAASGDRQDLARRLLNLTDVLRANDNATAVVLPDMANILAWLRAKHSSAERGLVHIVLPTEAVVAPWSYFERSAPSPLPVRKPSADAYKGSLEATTRARTKRKPKTPKLTITKKNAGVQLTIEEEDRDEPANTSEAVPKEQ